MRVSSRLSESAAVLIYDKNDPDYAMQSMLKQMGQSDLPKVKPILEINAEHEIFAKLEKDASAIYDVSALLLDMAKINEGIAIDDPAKFSKILTKIMVKAV